MRNLTLSVFVRVVSVNFAVLTFLFLGLIATVNAGPLIKDTQIPFGENAIAGLVLDRLQNSTEDSGLLELRVSIRKAKNLKGYGFGLQYDSTKYEFVDAVQYSKFFDGSAEKQALFVSSNNKKGEITVSGLRVDGKVSNGGGELVKFIFKTSRKVWRNPSDLDFSIFDGVMIDKSGGYNPVLDIEVGNLHGIPKDNALKQNVPNPFNPSTSIGYQLSRDGMVELAVYSVLGQKVRVLVDEFREAGFHTVVWDGTDNLGRKVASGVYGYRMSVTGVAHWRKMLLLK